MTNKIKHLFIITLLMFSVIGLVGCVSVSGNYIEKFSVSSQGKNKFSDKYDSLDGTKTYTIKAKECSNLELNVTTDSGKLTVEITDSNGQLVYQKVDIDGLTETITLEKGGKYNISFIAHEHSGSFSCKWEPK